MLQEYQLKNLLSSLEKLKQNREINNFQKTTSQIIIDIPPKKGEIEINQKGIFIREDKNSYIVEFQEPPLLKKKNLLDKELAEIKKQIESPKKGVGIANLEEKYREKERANLKELRDHKSKLEEEHQRALLDLQEKLEAPEPPASLTGRVIAVFKRAIKITGNLIARITGFQIEESALQPEKEFSLAFNGIVIEASPKDLKKIKASPYIKNIHINQEVKAFLIDSVPLINADKAWSLGYNGEGITIGIIDTGVDYSHPDLGSCTTDQFLAGTCSKVLGGYDFINNDNNPMDDHGHGTHVAATAAGNGTVQVPLPPLSSDYEEATIFLQYSSSALTDFAYVTFTPLASGIPFTRAFAYDTNQSSQGFNPILAHQQLTPNGRGKIHVREGENAQLSDWLIIAKGENDASLVGVLDLSIDTATLGSVTLENMLTGENIRVTLTNTTGIYASENRYFFGGGPYALAVDASGIFVNITWGNGSSAGNPGDEATVSPPIKLLNGSSLVMGTSSHILSQYGSDCSASQPPQPDTPSILIISATNLGKICTTLKPGEVLAIEEPVLFGTSGTIVCSFDSSGSERTCSDSFGNEAVYNYFDSNYSLMRIALLSTGGGGGGSSGGGNSSGTTRTPILGVAPSAKLYAYKVLSAGGSGSWDTVIAGIERSVDPNQDGDFSDHLDVISMSLGGGGDPDDPISRAVDNVVDAGVIAVIAAGNSGPYEQTIGSPGTARKAITVGATDKTDQIAEFSSRGPVVWSNGTLSKPDVVAPGVAICAAEWDSWLADRRCFDDKHIAISGTSMATPHVSGLVAILKQKFPNLSPEDIKNILKTTSKDLGYPINTQGAGRVDAIAALEAQIIISGELDFGNLGKGQTSATKNITIKNIANESLSITLAPLPATNEDKISLDAITLNKNAIVLAPQAEEEIEVTLNFPITYDGLFMGKILVQDSKQNYTKIYSFSRYSKITLVVEGDHAPYFYLHDNQMKKIYGRSQGWDFFGNSATFLVKSGSYTAHAINDFIDPANPLALETDEYILSDAIDIPVDAEITKTFRLSDARPFTIKGKTLSGGDLNLLEWHKYLVVYKNKYDFCYDYTGTDENTCVNNTQGLFCTWSSQGYCYPRSLNIGFSDPLKGDRVVYISNKPNNGLEQDVVFKYLGVPDA